MGWGVAPGGVNLVQSAPGVQCGECVNVIIRLRPGLKGLWVPPNELILWGQMHVIFGVNVGFA